MREIKFRAWSHLWKEAVGVLPVLTIDFVNRAVYVLPERELEGGNQEEWLFGEIDLMQYTGLKDKNGEEIYEGDIVMFLDRDWIDYEADTKRLPVVYENDAFVLRDTKPDRYGEFFSYSLFKDYGRDRFEVIGNIYEHGNNL